LEGRGDPPARVEQRLAIAAEEAAAARDLGMRHVVNDDLETALAELQALIGAGRAAEDPASG
jgi:guanylate kinase